MAQESAKNSRSPGQGEFAACTIISRNYLPFARILAESFARYEPENRFYVLIIDDLPDGADPDIKARVLSRHDLHLPHFDRMSFEYDAFELCTAVKPTLLRLLFDSFNEERVIYIDPDVLLFRPLIELREPLTTASIVITPSVLTPLPPDGLHPNEQEMLVAGAYNLGFVALRRTEQTFAFLRWWEEHLHNGEALIDVSNGLMTDQKWVDLVPGLFPDTVLLRDEGYNVAWWNMHERRLTCEADRFLVNGRSLTFFHFSGFDPGRPDVLTRECQNRIQAAPGSALEALLKLYAKLNWESGIGQTKELGYQFGHFDNGLPINLAFRRLYLGLNREIRKRFGNPFHTSGNNSFFHWAIRPDPSQSFLSPLLLSLYYRVRFDLWPAYPDIRGNDRARFLEWVRRWGKEELKFDPDVMRALEAREERVDDATGVILPFVPPRDAVGSDLAERSFVKWNRRLEGEEQQPFGLAPTQGREGYWQSGQPGSMHLELSQLRERVRSVEEEVVAERGRAEIAEIHLRAIEASTTWRATAPLRSWFSTRPTLTRLTRRTAKPVWRLLQRQPGGVQSDVPLADKAGFDASIDRPWVAAATSEAAPTLPHGTRPVIRPASSTTQRLNYYSSAGPDSRDYWPLFEECPCDVHFREFLALKDICGRSIFHFGTGVHHFVGLGELDRKNPNYIFAVTASPQEHAEFVRLIIETPALSSVYKVLFTDIYTMNDRNLPDFDIITLFHLCEYWDPIKSSYAPLNDKTLLDLMIKKLRPGGKIAAYPRSRTWEKACPLFEAAVEAKLLAVDDQFKTLQFYAKN